jgi:hypothetical protein
MKSHELFQCMSPALAAQIFGFLQKEQQPVYKAAIQGLANQRNLRPVFIERKPPAERFVWLQSALARKISEGVAAHLLQAWLLGANKQMLCDFLDALGITHDDEGTIEEVPPSPPKDVLARAVSELLDKYPAEAVAVYLHAFQEMDGSARWSALGELLQEEPRLSLKSNAPADVSQVIDL